MQIIILGMHRSGTSCVSRLVNMMGAYFAPEGKEMPPQPDNPKGHWERMDVMQLNDAILNSAGGTWDQVSHIDLKKINESHKENFNKRINSIVLGMDAHRPWSLKDPRMCLTLPCWLPSLEVPVFLLVYRNPIQIAQSLAKRNNIPLFVGIALWEYYMISTLNAVKGGDLVFTRYEDIMREPVKEVRRIYEDLTKAGVSKLRMPSNKEITAFLRPDLFHYVNGSDLFSGYLNNNQLDLIKLMEHLVNTKDFPHIDISKSSYEILKNYCLRKEEQEELSKEHQLKIQAEEVNTSLEKEHAKVRSELTQLQAALSDAGQTLAEKEMLIEALSQEKSRYEEALSKENQLKIQAEEVNASLEKEYAKVKSELTQLQTALSDAGQTLAEKERLIEALSLEKSRYEEALSKECQLKIQAEEANGSLEKEHAKVRSELNQLENLSQARSRQQEELLKVRTDLVKLQDVLDDTKQIIIEKENYIFEQAQKIEQRLYFLLSHERTKFMKRNRHTAFFQLIVKMIGIMVHPRRSFSYLHDRKIVLNSNLFDKEYYLRENDDVLLNYADVVEHFCLYGWKEGRNPHPSFDIGYYLSQNPDIAAANVNPLVHFEEYGWKEGRRPSADFDMDRYMAEKNSPQKKIAGDIQCRKNNNYNTPKKGEGKNGNGDSNGSNNNAPSVEVKSSIKCNAKSDKSDHPDHLMKESIDKYFELKLKCFLSSVDSKLEFPFFEKPLVSIILVLYNRAELTFGCIESIKAFVDVPYELIIVDNSSTDSTPLLLNKLKNVKIKSNSENIGFLKACNIASNYAAGDYILFLNNDTQILPATISELLSVFTDCKNVGAAGGKLIFPNGQLQEAGSILWKEGNALGYGRGENPFDYKYSYMKDVYFVSGALLMTKTKFFIESGMFDERYAPAYSEEVDYCIRLHKQGYRVVYNPFSIMIHHEFGSGKSTNAINLQIANSKKMVDKWGDYIDSFYSADMKNVIFAREFKSKPFPEKSILFVDDRIPDPALGSGYPRCFDILLALSDLGYRVSFFPLQFPSGNLKIIQALQKKGIEVIYNNDVVDKKLDFAAFFNENKSLFNAILISRPHNMKEISSLKVLDQFNGKIIYDCEALFSAREILFQELNGKMLSSEEKRALIKEEISLSRKANSIITVTQSELDVYKQHGASEGGVVGHMRQVSPLPNGYNNRSDILFVGGLLSSPSPNEDAIIYFIEQIFPEIQKFLPEIKLYIVGTNKLDHIKRLSSDAVIFTGRVDDLETYYSNCRICVIPTRYAAGIPYKFHEAASFGIPMVITPLIHEQVNGVENEHYLVGKNSKEFAKNCVALYTDKNLWEKFRKNVLLIVERDCNKERFCESIQKIFNV